MFIFLSYAREDREMVERIRGTLAAAGFDCFLDTRSLPPGQEYNARIGQAVARADLFIFLLSDPALEPGSYALTELAFAEKKWRNPSGHVLPVASAKFDFGALPAYLRPINVLQPRGSTEAEVLAWVQERAERGGGGGEETPGGRLARWARLHQPPLRRERKLPLYFIIKALAQGLVLVAAGVLVWNMGATVGWAPSGFNGVRLALSFISILFLAFGCFMLIGALVLGIQGLAGATPVAALVLDRRENRGMVTVHLLLVNDRRQSYVAVGRAAMSAYPGEMGWAFVAGGMMLGFEHGPQRQP